MSVQSKDHIDLRCPLGPKALLAKVYNRNKPHVYTDDNLLELSCRDCTKTLRKTNPKIVRVVHRFNILGQLVESATQES